MMLNYVNEHCTRTYVTAVGRQSEREKERERERESPCSPLILPSLLFPVTLHSHPISPPFPFPSPPFPSPLFFPSLPFTVLYSATLPFPSLPSISRPFPPLRFKI